jgi:cell division septal protein FtsQ
MAKQIRKPHKFKKKKPFYRNRFFWFGLLILIFLLSLFHFLFFSEFFQVKIIEFEEEQEENLFSLIWKKSESNILPFSSRNIFLIDLNGVEKDILKELPWLSEIKINRILPDKLSVSISKREVLLFFCLEDKFSSSPTEALTEVKKRTELSSPTEALTEVKKGTELSSPTEALTEVKKGTELSSPTEALTEVKKGTELSSPTETLTEVKKRTELSSPTELLQSKSEGKEDSENYQERCFALDKGGVVFREEDLTQKSSQFLIRDVSYSDKINLGDRVIEKENLNQIIEISSFIEKGLNIALREVMIFPEKLVFLTSQGWSIYFGFQEDLEWQLTKLKTLLDEKIPEEKRKNLEYIELRFGNFANPKYRN